jgi:hypothetical protein
MGDVEHENPSEVTMDRDYSQKLSPGKGQMHGKIAAN